MQIFGWISGWDGCAHYRIRLVFEQLNAAGHEATYGQLLLGERHTADVIVAQRQALPEQSWYWQRICREDRALCVYEMDDDLLHIDPDNKAAYQMYDPPEIKEHIRRNIEAAHLVTVTNEHLAVVAREFNDNVAVLPNFIPAWMLEHDRPKRDCVTVGWGGGNSHGRDFGEIAKPLRRYLQANHDVLFHNFGWDYTHRVRTPRGRSVFTPWHRRPDDYMRAIDFDIGLAPLRQTAFNARKTAVKALEHSALGIPTIASNVSPYREFVRDGETGVLFDTPREFEAALDEMVRDERWRQHLGANARLLAAEHTIEDNAWRWAAAYETALAKKRGDTPPAPEPVRRPERIVVRGERAPDALVGSAPPSPLPARQPPTKIRHYYHVYADGQWGVPVAEHIHALGSIDLPMRITVGVVGTPENRAMVRRVFDAVGIDVEHWREADRGWEQVTMARLRRDLKFHDDPVLYAHSKGASDPSPINVAWRESMSRLVVAGWRDCLDKLSTVDAVGCHWLTAEQYPGMIATPFFGGNFWWATARYLRTLPHLTAATRYDAERWIGLGKPTVHDLLPGWPSLTLFAANVKVVA